MTDSLFDDLVPKQSKRDGGLFDDLVPHKADFSNVTDAVSRNRPSVPVRKPSVLERLDGVLGSGDPVASQTLGDLVTGQTAAPRDTGTFFGDMATRVRQGVNNVVGGLAGAPVDIANLSTLPMRLSQRGGNALREAIGLEGLPEAHALTQPAVVQGIRESLAINNAAEEANLSPEAGALARQFQQQDGFLPSLGYLATHPGFAATEAAAQVPQFALQIVPGSTLGTIALQGASAASQNTQQIAEDLRAQGLGEQDIADRAGDAYAPSLLVNTLLPALVPGGSAIERVLAGKAGQSAAREGAGRLGIAAKGALGEIGTEAGQEGADQVVQNAATGRPLGEQVGQNMALGTLIGAPGGVLAGAYDAAKSPMGKPVTDDAPRSTAIPPTPPQATDAIPPEALGDLDSLLTANLPPEVVQAVAANPELAQAALGALTPEPAPAGTPPTPAPAEPTAQTQFAQQVAATMRQRAQEQGAQANRTTEQAIARAVQPSAPVPAPRGTGGDLAVQPEPAPARKETAPALSRPETAISSTRPADVSTNRPNLDTSDPLTALTQAQQALSAERAKPKAAQDPARLRALNADVERAQAALTAPIAPKAPARVPGADLAPGLYARGKNAQALKLDDGTWMVRHKKAGRWMEWEPRATFEASPTFGYRRAATGSGAVRLPDGRTVAVERAERDTRTPDFNPLLDLIARAGGISKADARRYGVDPEAMKQRRGIRPLFSDKGIPLDDLREQLLEDGYLPPEPVDAPPRTDLNDVWDLVDRALSGQPVAAMDDPRMLDYLDRQRREDDEDTLAPEDDEELARWYADLEAETGEDIAPGDEAELATIAELAERAARAGAEDFDIARFSGETDAAYAARLWDMALKEAPRGIDRQAEAGGVRERVRASEAGQAAAVPEGRDTFALQPPAPRPTERPQEVASQSGLFAPPTRGEQVRAAAEAKDASRNGLGRDLVRPSEGDGELLAGNRPAQARVDTPEVTELTEDDLTDDERVAFQRYEGGDFRKHLAGELSRTKGLADSQEKGLGSAVMAVVGKADARPIFMRGLDGLRGLATPDYIAMLQQSQEQRGGKLRTAGLYVPAKYAENGKPFYALFTDVANTPTLAAFTAAHEVAGHHGLRALLGDRLDNALDIALQNPTVQAVADAVAKARKMPANKRLLAAEEALADLAGALRTGNWDRIKTKHGVDVPAGIRSRVRAAIDNFIRRLRALLNKALGKPAEQGFSDAQVRALLEAAWQAAQGEAGASVLGPDGVLERSAIGQPEALESADNEPMDRASAVSEAKRLGLPATGSTESIANRVRIATADPATWTRADFDAILPYLSIHQDVRGDGADNVQSILRDGLRRGMVDSAERLEPGFPGWSYAKGYLGNDVYAFITGGVKFAGKGNPRLAPGNMPLFHAKPEKGGSLFDALVNATTPSTESDPTQSPAFRRWFGDSKVVDADGKPLVVYHGTGRSFDAFDPAQRGAVTRANSASRLFFFTDSPEVASDYADFAASVPVRDLVEKSQRLERQNKWDEANAAMAEAEALDANAARGQSVMPVYLAISNPLRFDAEGQSWQDIQHEVNTVIAQAARRGHDGIIVENLVDDPNEIRQPSTHYGVFHPEQIKSATGNRGTFDPSSPSILESVEEAEARAETRRDEAAATLPQQRGTPGWSYDANRWEGRAGQAKRLRAELQDKMLAFRDVQQQIESQLGRAIEDAQNVYRLETLMHGRVSEGIERIERSQVVPLVEAMQAAGVKPETLEECLYARHAKERNAAIAKINPAMPDGGSGMTNAEADAILAKADKATLEPLARKVDAITKATRKRLLDHGLITQEAFDAMDAQYAHYVPLRGKAEARQRSEAMAGRGVDSRGQPVKQALGRGAGNRAQHILGEVIGDAQRSVILAEKARVGRAAMRLVLANPNPALWEVEPVQTERTLDAAGEVVERVVNDWSDPAVLAVRHRGQLYRVLFRQPELAQALNHVGVESIGAITRAAGAVNRYFSAILTKYNPAFVPVNATRDALFGLTGLAVEHGEGAALDAALHYLPAANAAWRHARGVEGDSQWDRWAAEFAAHGGKTGYVNMPSAEDLARKVGKGRFGGYSPEGAAKAARAVADAIGHLNDGVENALRLSAYVTLRKRGQSADAAAEYAKNLTVNFNRKGYMGSKINAWFLFYNASLQGAHRSSKLLRSPKTYAYLGALAAIQTVATLAALGMHDDDGEPLWNKVPDHVKRRNLVIVLPPDKGEQATVLTLPMPYGFNLFPYLAGRIVGATQDQETSRTKLSDRASQITADTLTAALESFSPVPLDDGAMGLLPTVLRIPTNLQTNRNDFGRPIHRDDPYAKSDVPRASMGRPDTLEVFKLAANGLNRVGGGDEYTPPPISAFDVAPEDIEYLLKTLTGGAGQFVVDAATLGQKATDREFNPEITLRDVPIIKRFATNIDEQAAQQSLFYQRRDVIERALSRVRGTFETQGEDAAEALMRSLPELTGADFKRRKKSGRNGEPPGSPVLVDGRPQIVAARDDSVFGAYKQATETMGKFNEEVRDRYALAPASLIPNDKTRLRDAQLRTSERIRKADQAQFTEKWTRDVVGAAE